MPAIFSEWSLASTELRQEASEPLFAGHSKLGMLLLK